MTGGTATLFHLSSSNQLLGSWAEEGGTEAQFFAIPNGDYYKVLSTASGVIVSLKDVSGQTLNAVTLDAAQHRPISQARLTANGSGIEVTVKGNTKSTWAFDSSLHEVYHSGEYASDQQAISENGSFLSWTSTTTSTSGAPTFYSDQDIQISKKDASGKLIWTQHHTYTGLSRTKSGIQLNLDTVYPTPSGYAIFFSGLGTFAAPNYGLLQIHEIHTTPCKNLKFSYTNIWAKQLNAKVTKGQATFTIPAGTCPQTLTFSTYEYPADYDQKAEGSNYPLQQMTAYRTATYGPGTYTVSLPTPTGVYYQQDLYRGTPIFKLTEIGHPRDQIIAWYVGKE